MGIPERHHDDGPERHHHQQQLDQVQRRSSLIIFSPTFMVIVFVTIVILSVEFSQSRRYLYVLQSSSSLHELYGKNSNTDDQSSARRATLAATNDSSSSSSSYDQDGTEPELAQLAAKLHEKEQWLLQKEMELQNAIATPPCRSGESNYLTSRPDVIQAIQHGHFTSGYQHWIQTGRKEGSVYKCVDDVGHHDDGSLAVTSQPLSIPTHPMCQRLLVNASSASSSPVAVTASEIWIQNWDRILDASFFPHAQIDDQQRDIYRNLMIDIFPRLHDAVLTSSGRHRDVQRIWDILEARRLHPDQSPPLKVLVMGGSVTEGVGCEQPLSRDKDGKEQQVRGRDCNWSVRLEEFLNKALGYDGIKIVNIAQGGTGTSQAMALVRVRTLSSLCVRHTSKYLPSL
jgi:hypothetical protein